MQSRPSCSRSWRPTTAREHAPASDTVTVTVEAQDNTAPAFTSGADFSTNENQAATFQVTAMDPDAADAVSYAITGGADLAQFQINATSGLLTIPTSPDHENPIDADGDNVYLVTVTATGGTGARALSTDQAITVTVNDVDEPPAGSVSAQPETVLGGKDVQLTSSVADPENDPLTYAWTSSGGGTFTNASAANPRWTAPAAGTADRTVTLTLTVTDTVGETAFSTDVTVRANQPPTVMLAGLITEVSGGASQQLNAVVTDPEGDTLTYAWTSVGGGSFDNAGALVTGWTAPDATDTDQTVTLTLTVTDDGAGALSASDEAVITVRAQPQLAVTASAVPSTVNGGGTVQLSSTVTGAVGDVAYTWIAFNQGTLSSASIADPVWTARDAEVSDASVTLSLTVFADGGTASTDVVITVRGNQAPEVSLDSTATHVDGGEEVSLTASATDPEGDVLTYAWTSSAGGSFDDAGALDTTWTAPPATRQDQPVTLTLTVTDDGAGARSTTRTRSLTVRANEAPAGSVSAQPETVLGGKDVQLTSSVADPEIEALTYSWTSSGGGAFANASAANTRWTAPVASTADQTVTLTLTVTDTVGDTAFSTDVTVRENQPPTVALASIVTEVNGGVGVNLNAVATDPEGDTLTYAWTSDGGGSFADAGALDTIWIAPAATDADQTVMLTLTATDDGAGTRSASDTATVTVKAQSQLAVTITADPTTVNGGGTVQLSTTVTGAVGTVSYDWSGGGTFSSTSIHNPVWTAPSAGSSDLEVLLRLNVIDSGGVVLADVLITMRGNQAPEVSATADAASVAGGGAVTLDGTASDPEGDTLTYAWTSDGGGSFADAGALDTTWTAPDATDADQTVMLTLMATDDGAGTRSASDTVTVTVEAQAAPAVSDVDVTSEPGVDDTYAIGDTIQVTVTFDQAVTVTGAPRIKLRVGGGDAVHQKWAAYTSGSGNEALLFAYTVQAGDFDDNGIYIAADELELNGGTIQSSGGTDANLDYPLQGTQSGHNVDGVLPTPEFAATSGRRQLRHHHLQRVPVSDHRRGERLHGQRGHGHGAGGQHRHGQRRRGDQQPGGDGGLRRRHFGRRPRRGPGRGRQRRRELHHR